MGFFMHGISAIQLNVLGAGRYSSLVYISNIEYFGTLKACLVILFLSQGTNAVWGFNFLREGVFKTFQTAEMYLCGRGKKQALLQF